MVRAVEKYDLEHTGTLQLKQPTGRPSRFPDQPMRLTMRIGGGTFEAPVVDSPSGGGGPFRPTFLMEKVSRTLEAQPGLGLNAIRMAVKGSHEHKTLALQVLIAEGYVRVEKKGQAHRHFSVRPFRAEEPVAPEAAGEVWDFTKPGAGS